MIINTPFIFTIWSKGQKVLSLFNFFSRQPKISDTQSIIQRLYERFDSDLFICQLRLQYFGYFYLFLILSISFGKIRRYFDCTSLDRIYLPPIFDHFWMAVDDLFHFDDERVVNLLKFWFVFLEIFEDSFIVNPLLGILYISFLFF